MADIIDITVPLQPDMPTWPGSAGCRVTRTLRLEDGDPANVSRLDTDVHMGTHVDAPRHFLTNGQTVESLDLNTMIGRAMVAAVGGAPVITDHDLAALSLPPGTTRLLLRTANSHLWATGVTEFRPDYVALTADAARWVVDNGIRLLGVDYLSVQRFADDPTVHQVLLTAGVILLEGLDLSRVPAGEYELYCLPLRLVGAEAAPARAILRSIAPTMPAHTRQPQGGIR